jgi:hypothetical protein
LEVETIGGAARRVNRPEVEVSYDDGATWALAPVRSQSVGKYTARLQHPASGEVSLRATVSDQAVDRVVQTIVRAYHLVA